MKILALCGSVRNNSSNHALLKAVHSFLPDDCEWNLFDIRVLPFFDPELQFSTEAPTVVESFREQVAPVDYILIATPEYAHGIPGILKNALEWLVCEETMKKKVVIMVCTSSGGEYVREYLTETIRTMDLLPSDERTIVVKTARKDITVDGKITDPELKKTIQKFVESLILK